MKIGIKSFLAPVKGLTTIFFPNVQKQHLEIAIHPSDGVALETGMTI
jgi:hypothetical protein